MNRKRYKLAGGDGACYGPEFGPVYAEEVRTIEDQIEKEYLLVRLEEPLETEVGKISHLLIAPRYVGDAIQNIREGECTVGVWVVLVGVNTDTLKDANEHNAKYWSIGTCWSIST